MRQIKFRGWDGVGMIYCGQDQSWEHGWNLRWLFDHCDGNIMEFTGLLDKSGVEIYEGDIIDDDYRLYKVRFGEQDVGHDWQGIGFYLEPQEEWPWPVNIYNGCGEIIGNIYENKELLE